MSRRYLAALATAIVLIAAAGYVVVRRHHSSKAPATTAATTPSPPVPSTPPPRQPVLAGLPTTAPIPEPAALDALLARDSADTTIGGRLVGTVVDATTGSVLWSDGARRREPPASTTKLLTSAAALETLGPNHRFVTSTRRVGHVIYLVGGGDPTLLRTARSPAVPSYPQPATLADLAAQTAAALPAGGHYTLRLDSSAWTGPALAKGWSPDYLTEGDVTPPSALELDEGRLHPSDFDSPRTATPVAQAGAAFAALLRRAGVRLHGAIRQQPTPVTAAAVAQVESPPLSELVQRMLTMSDNDLAEALGRAVAADEHLPTTFVGAAAAVTHTVARLGVPASLISLHDTSGLSHDDRVAPAALADVLRAAMSATQPQLRSIIEGLPVGGLTGTLADRYRTKRTQQAAGLVRAKTGTLTGVNTLAGTVVDRSGRLLVFVLLTSEAPAPDATVNALDALVARLSTCGCATAG